MGRSRLQRTKPGLDYREGRCVGAPAAIAGQVPCCYTPNSTGSPARHGTPVHDGSGGRIRQGPGSGSHYATCNLRSATCDFEPRAAGGGGRDAAGFGSLTAPKPQDDTGTGGDRTQRRHVGSRVSLDKFGTRACECEQCPLERFRSRAAPSARIPQPHRHGFSRGKPSTVARPTTPGKPHSRRRTTGRHQPTVRTAVASSYE
ncbi:hypothetical protein ABH915_000190 [Arthrobacter sp. MW3 TE3886]